MSQLAILKPKTAIEKRTRTTVDTIMVTADRIAKWKLPSGQRPLKENGKVRAIAETIREDHGVIPGILTLGVFEGVYWIIDGQHRLHAFLLSGVVEGYADARFLHAESMADINREFVELNSKLVNMRPDDFLRGLAGSIPALQEIREACPFVGFDQLRRDTYSSMLSMSATLRMWRGSSHPTPGLQGNGQTAVDIVQAMLPEEVAGLIDFLTQTHAAFGRDPQYYRLWAGLNMTLCMWMYRNLVMRQYSAKSPRLDKLTFRKCLMSVSADAEYQDWLLGRKLGDRDRSPAYRRLKAIFAERLAVERGGKIMLPSPDWCNG